MNRLTLNTFLHISLLFLAKLSYFELSFTLFTFLLQSGKISRARYSKYIHIYCHLMPNHFEPSSDDACDSYTE